MPSPAATYAAKLDAIIAGGDRLDMASAREIYRDLNAARKRVAAVLADTPTDWGRVHFGVLEKRIADAMEKLRVDLGKTVAGGVRTRFEDGAELTDEMLAEFSGEATLKRIPIDRRQLKALNAIGADQVTNLAQQAMNDISLKLKLGAMGGKTPFEIMKDVAGALVNPDGTKAPGVFGDVLTRAEMIVRTEQGRAFAVAQQGRLQTWDAKDPGLLKFWLAVGGPRTRPSHARAGEEYGRASDNPGPIPVLDRYVLTVLSSETSPKAQLRPGEYPCLYPRAPELPAGLAVACRCTSLPFRAHWFKRQATREAYRFLREAAAGLAPCRWRERRAA